MNHKKGIAKVLPESLDDLWHLYNVISKGDLVHAHTTREVKIEDDYARPKSGKRISVFLGINVEKVVWDRSLNRLRVHGIVCDAPEGIGARGSHHTLNVTVDKPITIVKSEWPKHHIDRLERASKVKGAPITVISMDDEEFCVAILRQYGVDVRVEERTKLPGKLEAEKRAGAKHQYFGRALKFLREVWTNIHGPIVILGPGFIKNEFFSYLNTATQDVARSVIDVKGVNSAGVAGIHEALRSGVFTKALKHMRIAEETEAVEEILERLGRGRSDVTYGLDHVEKASTFGAVEKLLVADETLREAPDEKRGVIEKIMKEVEEKSGEILVISTEHEAGIKLLGLGGVAALLRFSLG